MEFTAEMIAGFLGGEVIGDKDAKVSDFAKIEEGRAGALSFMANPKYEHFVYSTESSIVIVDKAFEPSVPVTTTLIKVADAYGAFAKLLELYVANKPQKTGISSKADISEHAVLGTDCYIGAFTVVEAGAKIGNNVKIYPNCYIGDGVKIGDNTVIYAGVKVYENCIIGSNVILHAGSVIGADGFGFAPDDKGVFNKIPQIGNVIIEDNVDIGANTCIDRATMGSTIIHRGVKLDNLIQVGHNAVIGENTVAAAQLGVAGTSKIGKNCMFGGQVGIAGHITIADGVRLGSQSGVSNSIKETGEYMGSPPLPGMMFHRSTAVFRRLPELSNSVRKLEKQMAELTKE